MGNVLAMCCGPEDGPGNVQKRPRVTAGRAPGAMKMDNTPPADELRAQMAAAAQERERQNATRGTQRETYVFPVLCHA
jgi:hypothetical protein